MPFAAIRALGPEGLRANPQQRVDICLDADIDPALGNGADKHQAFHLATPLAQPSLTYNKDAPWPSRGGLEASDIIIARAPLFISLNRSAQVIEVAPR